MQEYRDFYINGAWVKPQSTKDCMVINPATEQPVGVISLGAKGDVDKAVAAAKKAFPSFSRTSREERLALLEAIVQAYQKRYDDIANTITSEMGAPLWLAKQAQAATGLGHFMQAMELLKGYKFEEQKGKHVIVKDPVGVCAFITPWNWPINQIACKVAPALAAGCTVVLKPSEVAPLNACLLAEIMDDAGVPPGVFNLVNGDGPGVGEALSSHPDVDMVSFTGSTRAGILVARAAADTVKRVTQELGGKSANIILDDADLTATVSGGVSSCFLNSGQSCNAPTRMLVPAGKHAEAVDIARAVAQKTVVGDPTAEGVTLGPVVSETQYDKIQGLIQTGIDEKATLVAGGTGKPEGMNAGYFVRPTVFADVNNTMTIAREEVFGPVLSIMPYKDEAEAIAIANDTPYGLAGYVSSKDPQKAREVALRLRAGMIHLNGANVDFSMPFGGYKQSGNGREWGEYGLEEFLEVKSILNVAS